MMMETRDSIAEWANATFGEASDRARIGRALEEMREAGDALNHSEDTFSDLAEELADVTICLCAAPASAGLDVAALVGPEVWRAVEHKMKTNRARKWRLRGDGNGDHIKEPNQ
jgi:NTP pyrophosphatase (non-canonical NTP hydrolase)